MGCLLLLQSEQSQNAVEDFDKEAEEAVVLLVAILAEVLAAVIRLLIIRLGLRLSFSMELSST